MAFQNEKEQDQTDDRLDMAEEPADGNGQPEREKRRGRAARRRRREDVVQVTLAEPEEAEVEEIPRRKDTPTPGRRQKDQAGNFITRAFRPLTTYLQETIVELRKVTWPTRQEATRLSGIVLGVTLVSAMVLGLYNYVLSIGLDVLLRLIP